MVYIDTDQQSGRDQYGRLVAVVYVRYNSTHYVNVNEALLLQGVAVEKDYSNNEFNPSTWILYVKYADTPSPINIGPTGPQGLQGVQGIQGSQGVQGLKGDSGTSVPMEYVYASLGISLIALIIAVLALTHRR